MGIQEVAALQSPNFQVHISALRPGKWLRATELVFGLVVLIFAASWSSVRGQALVHGDRLKANKELTVLGVCNMVSSPFARPACRCRFFSQLGQCCCWRAKPLGRYCSSFYRCGRSSRRVTRFSLAALAGADGSRHQCTVTCHVPKRFDRGLAYELSQLGASRNFVVLDGHTDAVTDAGVMILRPEEPLFFALAERVAADTRWRQATSLQSNSSS